MQWAGGEDWESYVDKLADDVEDGVIKSLSKDKRLYPKDWEWKGEHWKIARSVFLRLFMDSAHAAGISPHQATNTCLSFHSSSISLRYIPSSFMLVCYPTIHSKRYQTRNSHYSPPILHSTTQIHVHQRNFRYYTMSLKTPYPGI